MKLRNCPPMSFFAKFFKTLLANFTSRRFIVALVAFVVERWDYWDNIVAIYTFTAPGEAQLQAFIALNQQHRYLLGAIVLFYIGLQTVSNSSFTASSALQNLVSSASGYAKSDVTERIYNCEKLDAKDIPDADEH